MIRFLTAFALTLALAPAPLRAEPQPAVLALMPYMDVIETCLDAAPDATKAETCIGRGSQVCMDTESDGFSTLGMMFCLLAEAEAWDRLLNREYSAARDGLAAMDAQEAELFPEYAERADWLLEAQRAWIPFRDGQCALEYAMWGSGSMRNIAGADCQMLMTADRAIFLKFLGSDMR